MSRALAVLGVTEHHGQVWCAGGLPRSVLGEMKLFGPQPGPSFPPKQLPNCLLCHIFRQSEASGAHQLWHSSSSSKAVAGDRFQACWCPVFYWVAPGQSVWGSCRSLVPHPCVVRGLGLLPGNFLRLLGPGGSAPVGKARALPCSHQTQLVPREKGGQGDMLGQHQCMDQEHRASTGLPWRYGALQPHGPLSSPTFVPWTHCAPQGSRLPAGSALLWHQ